MRPILVIALAALTLTMPKLTLVGSATAEAESATEYLKAIGVDPQSAELKSVAHDTIRLPGGGTVSLNELAKQRKSKAEILRFINTRRFLHAYREDPTTRLPATVDYEAAYLTPEERTLVQPAFRRAGDELYLRSLQQKQK